MSNPLVMARAKFAEASRDEYPGRCTRCEAPLRLHQETFRDSGRWTDPVGRTLCLPPHRGRHRAEGSDR
jgi:hypothetical protein